MSRRASEDPRPPPPVQRGAPRPQCGSVAHVPRAEDRVGNWSPDDRAALVAAHGSVGRTMWGGIPHGLGRKMVGLVRSLTSTGPAFVNTIMSLVMEAGSDTAVRWEHAKAGLNTVSTISAGRFRPHRELAGPAAMAAQRESVFRAFADRGSAKKELDRLMSCHEGGRPPSERAMTIARSLFPAAELGLPPVPDSADLLTVGGVSRVRAALGLTDPTSWQEAVKGWLGAANGNKAPGVSGFRAEHWLQMISAEATAVEPLAALVNAVLKGQARDLTQRCRLSLIA